MQIGGLQKNSFIDFPGHIAAVVFVAGCNFRCPYCHNPELLTPGSKQIKPEEVFTFLAGRQGKIQGVVISGGEPTIYPDLLEFCEQIKKMGFAIKLDTNGSNPDMLEALLDAGLLDYVAMDLKADPKAYPKGLAPQLIDDGFCLQHKLLSSMKLMEESSLACEFRTTCAAPFISEEIIRLIAKAIAEFAPRIPLWLQRVNWDLALEPKYSGSEAEQNLELLRELALKQIKVCEIR